MSKATVMRFGGLNIPHNPKNLKIVRSKKINSVRLIDGEDRLSDVFEGVSKISGTAELYGSGCFGVYEKLLRLRFQNRSEILAIPEVGAVRAVLSDLTVLCEARKDFLEIGFEFRTVTDGRKAEKLMPYKTYTASEGESLWDIAYNSGTAIEKLVELNPSIRNINSLDEGKEVRIY